MKDIKLFHPRLQTLAAKLSEECRKQGLKIKIGDTFRTKAEQDELYAQGRTKPGQIVTKAPGGNYSSYHQWGTAFDIYRADGKGAYYDDDGFFTKVGRIGTSIGLEWGGDWKGMPDKPHFQLPDWGSSTAGIKKLYATPMEFMRTWVPKQQPEGWVRDAAGWWYRNEDGTWPAIRWRLIDHHWYLFGTTGYMITGWVQWDGEKTGAGDWYYLEEAGEFQGACWHEMADGKGGLERWYV